MSFICCNYICKILRACDYSICVWVEEHDTMNRKNYLTITRYWYKTWVFLVLALISLKVFIPWARAAMSRFRFQNLTFLVTFDDRVKIITQKFEKKILLHEWNLFNYSVQDNKLLHNTPSRTIAFQEHRQPVIIADKPLFKVEERWLWMPI